MNLVAAQAYSRSHGAKFGWSVVLVVRWLLLTALVAPTGLSLIPPTALGRDLDGRYTNSTLKRWFEELKSPNGSCCSDADGYVVKDADWEAQNGHYRVRVPEGPNSQVWVWIDVPDNSVITEPNKAERTIVWPIYFRSIEDDRDLIWIRCFMPGSMT